MELSGKTMVAETPHFLAKKLLSTKAGNMVVPIAGIILIALNIKDPGVIDIKAEIFTGHLRTGSVGVLLVFMWLVQALFDSWVNGKRGPNQRIRVRKGETEIEWQGDLKVWDEAPHIAEFLRAVQNLPAKTNRPTTREPD